MSIVVNNTDNQLNILKNGVLQVYSLKTIKSVGRAVDASGNNYIDINFIANDKDNSVRIPLNLVTSPVTWTNDTAGAIISVQDIRSWLNEVIEVNLDATNDQVGVYGYVNGASGSPVPLNVNATGQVAIQDGGNSITVDGGTGVQRTPTFLRPTGTSGTVAAGAYSVSFASVGTANATVGGITLKSGETLNFDAGAINNTLAAITYDTTTAGAELIIIKLT